MRKSFIVWILVIGISLCLFSAVHAEEQKWCSLCSMNLKMFWKTSHWLTFSDGKTTGYCSIHCASKIYEIRPTDIDRWEVVDYDMKTLINAYRAYFLIGSNLPGTMTPMSKLAFASQDVARNYQKEHGGTIGSLEDALTQAIEGRGGDMALIKERKAKMSAMGKKLARKHGCFRCHGEGGKGGTAVAWNSSEFARNMDSRVKIKKVILGGSHKMQGYQGKMTEKELHPITIYVWTQRPE